MLHQMKHNHHSDCSSNASDSFSNCNMSDNSDGGDTKFDDVCRDYLRNVCKRGNRCRYRHPQTQPTGVVAKKAEYTFCHDFQNTGCRRPNCKFVHCTREEEEYYKTTRQLPVRLQQAAALGLGVQPTEVPLMKGEVPICKDYLKGDCKRGSRCKYRHISATEYDYELRRLERRSRSILSSRLDTITSRFDTFDRFDAYESATVGTKRRRIELDDYDHADIYTSIVRPSTISDYKLLEEENILLRRKLDDLRKQCCDLAATNEVLLEQNARYRIAKANAVTLQTVTSAPTMSSVPTMVTVSRVMTPASTQAPLMASSMNAAAMNTCTITSLPQAIALNTELVSQQVVMQQIAQADIASQQAANLPPQQSQLNHSAPVTIGPPVSMNQGAIPITVSSVPQNLPPVVSMAASLPQISMSGPNAPMVSYPIVSHTQTIASHSQQTHVVRPALQ